MKAKARPRTAAETVDFGEFSVTASLSVRLDRLPPSLRGAVFVAAREGLGYWEFVDLDTDLGRLLIGQEQRRDFGAALWCEKKLTPDEVKHVCDGLFGTGVQVINPDTGEVW